MNEPDADERRVRAILRTRGVGPDAIPPKPAGRPRDWLDDILDTTPTPAAKPKPKPAPAEKPAPPPAAPAGPVEKTTQKPATRKKKRRGKKRKRPGPDTPRSAWDTRPPSPRESLLDAWDRVPYRLKWLGYHAAAAYLGWAFGLVSYATYVTAWIADTGLVGVQAAFWYGAAGATFLLHHRTRGWWWPVAWLAAVPASSVVVGVLLHGTPHL